MSENERESWNRRYRDGSHLSLVPDPFLAEAFNEFIQPIFPDGGKAVDLAGGIGRHSIWLAERAWTVTLMDISEAGLAKAQESVGPQAGKIKFEIADATKFRAREHYDLVAVFFYLEREIFPELVKALSPGGLIVYKTYTHLHPQFGSGPSHPMHLLQENELLRSFAELKILHYNETIAGRGVAELVAQKS
ncbi:MAG: class I SAM-dependent methyltransferase [Acidobacteriota bacterium]|jgi:tellurite methyltransferase|nr:class I SAM-dependent methyltransferase [Acidobacteriota bacterium]